MPALQYNFNTYGMPALGTNASQAMTSPTSTTASIAEPCPEASAAAQAILNLSTNTSTRFFFLGRVINVGLVVMGIALMLAMISTLFGESYYEKQEKKMKELEERVEQLEAALTAAGSKGV